MRDVGLQSDAWAHRGHREMDELFLHKDPSILANGFLLEEKVNCQNSCPTEGHFAFLWEFMMSDTE
jgi:hypothetical protein